LHLSIMAGWLSWANKKDSSGETPVELLMTVNFATRVRQVWAKWYYRALEIANSACNLNKIPQGEFAQWKTLCVNWYLLMQEWLFLEMALTAWLN
jgi:hypothetical protein